MTALLLNLAGWIGVIAIAVFGMSLLRAVRRTKKGGFDVHAEERRLRDDPRFASERVKQMAGAVPADPGATGGDPAAPAPPGPEA